MTRLVAGSAKGISLKVPAKGTRPTSEKVREAIFSHLGDRVSGAVVADLYAGSGALGIEALSRGARWVFFVDAARPASQVVHTNLRTTGFSAKAEVHVGKVIAFLESCTRSFDLALLDPPYNMSGTEISMTLKALIPRLHEGSTVVFESSKHSAEIIWPTCFTVYTQKKYGDTVVYYAYVEDTGGSEL